MCLSKCIILLTGVKKKPNIKGPYSNGQGENFKRPKNLPFYENPEKTKNLGSSLWYIKLTVNL